MNRQHKRRIVSNDICTSFTSQLAFSTVAKSLASCFLFRKSRIHIWAQRPVYLKLNKVSFPCHFEIPCSFSLSLTASSHCLRHCDQCTVCLPTGPQPLPKPVPHKVRSTASSFNFSFPSDNPAAPHAFFFAFPSLLSFPLYFLEQRVVEGSSFKDVTNPVSLPVFLLYAGHSSPL